MTFLFDIWQQDLRYAFRQWMRSPGFAAIALATLALGIGANSAIFSLVYGVMLRPLPYPEPDRVVVVERLSRRGDRGMTATGNQFAFWRDHQHALERVAATSGSAGVSLESSDRPERVMRRSVTAEFFRVLRLQPQIGRDFTPEEDHPGAAPVAIISHGMWQRHYSGDSAVLGRSISLGSNRYTVIGVAPPGIDSTLAADVWVPLTVSTHSFSSGYNYTVLGRLRDDTTLAAAQADLQVVGQQYWAAYPALKSNGETATVMPYQREAVGSVRPALLVLLGAVGLVLLIACVNVANLLLARVAGRRRELAVRIALGAARGRVLSQMLIESLALSAVGALLGLGLAQLTVRLVVSSKAWSLPRLDEVAIDGRVLLFTIAMTVLTGLLAGVMPAWQAWRGSSWSGIQEGSARTSDGPAGQWTRRVLVMAEFTVSLILLVGAGLLVQSFVRLRLVDPGFNPEQVLTMQMTLTGPRYQSSEQVTAFSEQLLQRVSAVPGVTQATVTNYLPLGGGFNIPLDSIEGQPNPDGKFLGNLEWFGITPQFFDTLQVKLRGGRMFQDRDRANTEPVVIVNEAFARRYFPNGDAVGQRITIAWDIIGKDAADARRQIVGVVSDIRESRLTMAPQPAVFVPLSQVKTEVGRQVNSIMPTTLLVRTGGDPLSVSRALAERVRSADPLLPVFQIRPMTEVVSDSIRMQRFLAALIGGFALVALVLAAVGIYGVMSYTVTQRTREIGIRAALGAAPGQLLGMVLRQGLALAATGAVVGLIGAKLLAHVLASFLYGVTAGDLMTFAAAPLLLMLVTLLACLVPAYRALRVDPLEALR